MPAMKFFVSCAKGLEYLLADELVANDSPSRISWRTSSMVM